MTDHEAMLRSEARLLAHTGERPALREACLAGAEAIWRVEMMRRMLAAAHGKKADGEAVQ